MNSYRNPKCAFSVAHARVRDGAKSDKKKVMQPKCLIFQILIGCGSVYYRMFAS